MEKRLALNYLNLTVKRKISKVLELWKKRTLLIRLKTKPQKKRLNI